MAYSRHIYRLGGTLLVLWAAAAGGAPEVIRGSPPIPIFKPWERIVFLGDMTIDAGCWRPTDLHTVLWQDYDYLIAAEYGAAYPERHLVFINRGISSDKIADLEARWQKDALEVKPDILTISIGVNDLAGKFGRSLVDTGDYEKIYDQLLVRTRGVRPDLKLILCEPFVYPDKRTRPHWQEWVALAGRYQSVVNRLGEKFHVPVVHFQDRFNQIERAPSPPDETDSGVTYPAYADRQWMADEWVRTYQNFYGLAAPKPKMK